MKTEKIIEAVKEAIEKDIVEAIQEVDISYYLNKKQIKTWMESVVKNLIASKVSDAINLSIMKEIKKHQLEIDEQVQRLVFEEVSKKLEN